MSKKILVVDDEPDILKVVVFRLKSLGYEIFSAVDGKQALELIKAEKPDLVLLDYRLPFMDGLEVTKSVKNDESLKHTVIILLTASGGEYIEDMVKYAGVDDYLKKPFDSQELLDKIKKYL